MHFQDKLSLLEEKQIVIGIDIAKHTHYASIMDKNTGRGKDITTDLYLTHQEAEEGATMTLGTPQWKKIAVNTYF